MQNYVGFFYFFHKRLLTSCDYYSTSLFSITFKYHFFSYILNALYSAFYTSQIVPYKVILYSSIW